MSYFDFEVHQINGTLPLGYNDESGLLWVVTCLHTAHGDIPGKLDQNQIAYYVWGGREHHCQNWETKPGTLHSDRNKLPHDCHPTGQQNDSQEPHFNVVVPTQHGLIPGKGLYSSNTAWFGYNGHEIVMEDNCYYVC